MSVPVDPRMLDPDVTNLEPTVLKIMEECCRLRDVARYWRARAVAAEEGIRASEPNGATAHEVAQEMT